VIYNFWNIVIFLAAVEKVCTIVIYFNFISSYISTNRFIWFEFSIAK